jgi:hypothetical protein
MFTESQNLATKRKRIMSDLEDMSNCDDCGQVFATIHDLQRHVKLWCPERTSLKRKREDDDDDDDSDDDVNGKKWIIPKCDEEKEIVDDDAVRDAYKQIYDQAKANHAEERQQKIDK